MTTAELAFNRLAAPEFRPVDVSPPWWHTMLDHFGLFAHYFASTLAIGLVAYTLWRLRKDRDLCGTVLSGVLVVVGLAFLILAISSVASSPGEQTSFWFETSFIAVILVLSIAQLRRGGDIGAKIGILLLAMPLIVHYYAPFAIRFLDGGEMLDLPERIRDLGQWSMIVAALATPYCFAPRPFLQSAARIGPFTVAMFVSIIGIVIVRQHYEAGMRLAQQGLGIHIGPGAPTEYLALYLIALGTVAWTITACLTADSVSRREIGVGLGLIVVAGYGFAWPLQYLASLVGLIGISEATRRVASEESGAQPAAPVVRAPPITDSVWKHYVTATAAALKLNARPRDRREPDNASEPRDEQGSSAPAVTVRGEDGHAVTHLVTRRHGVDIALRVDRHAGAIASVDIVCGQLGAGEPSWTLYARPERLLGIGSHPEPPATSAPAVKSNDRPFDERFRLRDAGGLTGHLLDAGRRARAIALIDGWLAFWPGDGLCYRVEPGHGAPLDHPIPISEMAFRGNRAEASVDRLVAVIDFLAEIAARGLAGDTPDE